jgi:hypothetical protein
MPSGVARIFLFFIGAKRGGALLLPKAYNQHFLKKQAEY